MRYGFGIDLGGTSVKLAFFNENGDLLDKWEIPTRTCDGGAQILPDIADSVGDYLRQHRICRDALLGIGIGVPGPVEDNGTVNGCDNLGWGRYPVATELAARAGLPVCAENDAKVAALGECWKGSGSSCKNMLLVTLGTGVGSGLIADGQLLRGVGGAAGELGHTVINREETVLCSCGKRGCLEQYCSATGIVRLARLALSTDAHTSCLRQIQPLTCKAVTDAAKAGDPLASAVMEQVFAYLGEAIANVCTLLAPEAVVIGGGVSRAGQYLLDGIRRHFDRYVYYPSKAVPFRLATLGNDAGAYGAFKLALDHFL